MGLGPQHRAEVVAAEQRSGDDARVYCDAEQTSVAAAARELGGEGEARQLGSAVPSVRAYTVVVDAV